MGLVNRVVPDGADRSTAEQLARRDCRVPDRRAWPRPTTAMSTVEQKTGPTLTEAMANEWAHGQHSLAADALAGAARFVQRPRG